MANLLGVKALSLVPPFMGREYTTFVDVCGSKEITKVRGSYQEVFAILLK